MHLFSARDIFGLNIPDNELVESHPECREHKQRYYKQRQKAKAGVHAVDYYCQDRTLAVTLGISVHEAGKFIKSWFGAHPGIQAWHQRTIASLQATRTVHNKWGYRRIFYDRLDSIIPEALAWIPQSTVGITINKIWYEIYSKLPEVQVLLQVHDSLAGQFPTAQAESCITGIRELARSVVIPYDIPLNIPLGTKTSTTSWGDCA
jgi:DNA polymerase I-like protein with 3'-5' exonuclease and polymerase domains